MAVFFLGFDVEFLPGHRFYGTYPGALTAMVISTHSLEEAQKIADQVFAQELMAPAEEQHADETTLELLRTNPDLAQLIPELRERGIGMLTNPYEQNPISYGDS